MDATKFGFVNITLHVSQRQMKCGQIYRHVIEMTAFEALCFPAFPFLSHSNQMYILTDNCSHQDQASTFILSNIYA